VLPELTRTILRNWNSLFPGVKRPKTLHYLGIPGSIEGGTTTFLAFMDRGSKPSFAVKIHRAPEAQARVLNERRVLSYLHSQSSMLIKSSVPQVILCERIAGVWVLVQSILDGRPMVATMTRDSMPELKDASANIQLAADWLAQLRAATRDDGTPFAALLKQDGLKMIEEFSSTFDLSPGERNYLKVVRDGLDVATAVGSFVQHGDFCRHNILISRDPDGVRVGVIDWTDSKKVGFPLHDMFFFLTAYYLQVRKQGGLKGFIRAFEDTFLNSNPYSIIVKRCLTDHCRQVGVDITTLETLFVMFLLERALFEYRQVMRCSRRGALPRFTLYLAALEGFDYPQALKAQTWIHFFRVFVERRRDFIDQGRAVHMQG